MNKKEPASSKMTPEERAEYKKAQNRERKRQWRIKAYQAEQLLKNSTLMGHDRSEIDEETLSLAQKLEDTRRKDRERAAQANAEKRAALGTKLRDEQRLKKRLSRQNESEELKERRKSQQREYKRRQRLLQNDRSGYNEIDGIAAFKLAFAHLKEKELEELPDFDLS